VQGFGGKAQRKKATRKTKTKGEDRIGMDLREMGWGSVEWIQLAQDTAGWLL
jgi:hypothetical protein